jgi:hypothetical protein
MQAAAVVSNCLFEDLDGVTATAYTSKQHVHNEDAKLSTDRHPAKSESCAPDMISAELDSVPPAGCYREPICLSPSTMVCEIFALLPAVNGHIPT